MGGGTGEGAVQVGGKEVVAYLCLRCAPKEAVPMNTCQAPVVLTLQERTAGEAIDLQGDAVLSLSDILRDIELRRQIGILRIAHTLAVDPQVIAVAHAVEAHVDVAVFPVGRNSKGATIGAHGVGHRAVIGEPARTVGHDAIGRLVEREGIGHVTIERLIPRLSVSQAPYLPAAGHVDVGPRRIAIVLGTIVVLG